MKLAVFAYSRKGCETARALLACFPEAESRAYTAERLMVPDFLPLTHPSAPLYGEAFSWADALLFVGSCGIAVRMIAPHLRDKSTDPAVLCIDELRRFVIPLLSGHIGGANELAAELAEKLGAVPVITTATDIRHRFSVDAWAARQGYIIDDLNAAKAVSAAILERDVPLFSTLPVATAYPAGVVPGESGELGILIGWTRTAPFRKTLRLIPPVLHLGIGCRRGVTAEAIGDAVETALRDADIDRRAIRCAATIDLKADEAGLIEYCEKSGWPLHFYSARELAAVEGAFTASDFVRSVTGVDNVCERAALRGAERLILKKTAKNGVTVAVAAEHLEVRFA